MIIDVDKKLQHFDSYAVERTRGLYNVGVEDGSRFQFSVDVPIEKEDWQIGAVIGPSGSGKSSVLQEIAKRGWLEYHAMWGDAPIIEQLGSEDYAKATAALAAVGLGSVPSWLRPRQVLSMGEGFRADLAQLLLGQAGTGRLHDNCCVLIDEFTSVLDRQVAQVGAGAFARAWRRKPGRRVIVFGPHYDILEWLQPDWWIDTAEGLDKWSQDRGVVVPVEGTFRPGEQGRYDGPEIGRIEC